MSRSKSERFSADPTLKLVTDPEKMFEQPLELWCEEGPDVFRKKDYHCSHEFPDGVRCSILKEVHGDEHVDAKGRRVPGQFIASPGYEADLTKEVRKFFVKQYERLCQDKHGQLTLPSPNHPRASSLRRDVLGEFATYWQRFQSNKTCLSCLQACPDHMLPCGHSFCDHCVMEFGTPAESFEYSCTFKECILCQDPCSDATQIFHLHPPCAGWWRARHC